MSVPAEVRRHRGMRIYSLIFGVLFVLAILVCAVVAAAHGSALLAVLLAGLAAFWACVVILGWRGPKMPGRWSADASGTSLRPNRTMHRLGVGMLAGLVLEFAGALVLVFARPQELAFILSDDQMDGLNASGKYIVLLSLGAAGIFLAFVMVQMALRSGYYLQFTPEEFIFANTSRIKRGRWDDVRQILDVKTTRVIDPDRPPESYQIMASPALFPINMVMADGTSLFVPTINGYGVESHRLREWVRFYWRHPRLRGELVDDRGLQRLRYGRFDAPAEPVRPSAQPVTKRTPTPRWRVANFGMSRSTFSGIVQLLSLALCFTIVEVTTTVLAFKYGEYLTGVMLVCLNIAVVAGLLAWWLRSHTSPRATVDHTGTTLWPDPRLEAAIFIGLLATMLTAALFGMIFATDDPDGYRILLPDWPPAVGIAILVLVVPPTLAYLVAALLRGGTSRIRITAEGFEFANVIGSASGSWQEVVGITDSMPNQPRFLWKPLGVTMIDGTHRVLGAPGKYTPHTAVLLGCLRFYWQNPYARSELTDQRAAQRLRAAAAAPAHGN